MDVAGMKLRDLAGLRWGGGRSPHFDAMLAEIEAAIDALPRDETYSAAPWPPAPLPPATAPRLTDVPARRSSDPTEAGAAALAAAIAAGTFSAAEVAEAFLERSARLDPVLRVWAALDPAVVRREASRCDKVLAGGDLPQLLAGVPVGVKDIFATSDYPTAANSRVAPGFREGDDAVSVARLRAAGAYVCGKTATTEYAYADAAETRNPWNPRHTPGGSSSGSAAGVAARLMPAALGTQTGGSVLRPAAYCGIVGFKPTTERISRAGVYPLAPSLDHAGTLTRSVADAALLYRVMTGAAELAGDRVPPSRGATWRLALWPDLLSDRTDSETREAIRRAAGALPRSAFEVVPIERGPDLGLPDDAFALALAAHTVIMAAEVSVVHLGAHPDRVADLGPRLRAMVEAGALIPARALLAAQSYRHRCWRAWHDALERTELDAVIVPSAPGPAPAGLESTGNPALNAPWSLLGVPAITLPIALAGNGLPLGMQIVAPYGEDARLLGIAAICERAIGFSARPAELLSEAT